LPTMRMRHLWATTAGRQVQASTAYGATIEGVPRRPQLQIHTRLPEALHEQLKEVAADQDMSLNAAINQACAMWVGWVQGAAYQSTAAESGKEE
jgi:hypothetical protein